MDSTAAAAKISPFVSPNSAALLKKTVVAWSLETGLPASVHVHVDGKIFNLHKFPLVSKCGYFSKALLDSSQAELPERFPGGCEMFETVALFCYNSTIPFDPFNVAALRCAAHVLDMTEEYYTGGNNLCERSDLYLTQVVLQSWDDTLIVLQRCQALLPWAEELLVVSRCVESLAFMACMEILDPERKRGWPVTTLHSLAGHSWSCELAKEMASRGDLWIKDLIALPFDFFNRIITSLRRQGMKEKYVNPIIVFYANKWLLSKKTYKFWEKSSDGEGNIDGNEDTSSRISDILQGIVGLLPVGENASRVIPAGFYFSLLSRSMTLNLSEDSRMRLQEQVASLLHLAQVEDFLLPETSADSITSTPEFEAMERIVSIHVSAKNEAGYSGCLSASSAVAELWDRYLSQIAMDPRLEPGRFKELIQLVPMADRETHDHLYRALNTYLLEHPHLSSEEKPSVCKYLNCQKLSQEVCIDAVQNELMPLRLIVQALFVQQLQTHQAFKECSDSFRCIHYEEYSRSLSSSRGLLPRGGNLEESPFKQASNEGEPIISQPLGSLLQKDISTKRSEVHKEDYESTSFRLQALEHELMSLKLSLRRPNVTKGSNQMTSKAESFRLEGRTVVKKVKPLGQVRSCIGLSWASQRKYASRLLKIVRRITMLGKGKSNMKKAAASSLSSTSLAC